MKRTFLGFRIEPTDIFLEDYQTIRQQLKTCKINWVRPDNMHITLHFFGDTPDDLLSGILRVLSEKCGSFKPFELDFRSIGVFSSVHHPKVIWAGCDPCLHLAEIKTKLDEAFGNLGILSENREFKPHLTLGRIKGNVPPELLTDLLEMFRNKKLLHQDINRIVLYESKLHPSGPVYYPLQKFSLGRYD